MKVSIITAVYNGAATIAECVQSVLAQTYPQVEYIIVDGNSTDKTLEVIAPYRQRVQRLLSEPDTGVYNALNKGIRLATGDIIGILHADDVYSHQQVIAKMVDCFRTHNIDACYADLQYVAKTDPDRVIRQWRASPYTTGKFYQGWMPPHPTLFVARWVYERYGGFNETLRIAADYEFMLRVMEKYQIKTWYLPEVTVKMRVGGLSNRSLRNLLQKTREDYQAWRLNGLPRKWSTIPWKNLSKIGQFFG